MSGILGVVAASLGGLLLWALLAPRSNWRTLTGWSVSDPYRHEPGAGSYGLRRLVAGLGVLGLVSVLIVASSSFVRNLPQPAPPKTPVQQMWGDPDPQVVNRVVVGTDAAPAGLPAMTVLGYQPFGDNGPPSYLSRLKPYSLLGKFDIPGYIGATPDDGFAAIDTTHLVVNVRGPILCVPRAAVVIETDSTIEIGIYYGLPDAADGSAIDQIAGCPTDSALTASLLIPIKLSAPVGDRSVQALDGTGIPRVPNIVDSK